MYSLALLVAIIFIAMLFSGPIAIGLTFIPIKNPVLRIIRRIFVIILSTLGIGLGIILIFEGVAIGAKLFSLFAITVGVYGIKREFSRK